MSSSIIECSRQNAIDVDRNNNGVWSTTLKESIEINQGDQILLRNSFIDVLQSSSEDVVSEGQTLVLTYGYYEYNSEWTDKTVVAPKADQQDYKPYVLYTTGSKYGQVLTLSFMDKYSTPDPNPLEGNMYFRWTNRDGTIHFDPEGSPRRIKLQFVSGPIMGRMYATFDATVFTDWNEVIKDSVVWLNQHDKPWYDEDKDNEVEPQTPFSTNAETGNTGQHLILGTSTIVLPKAQYDPTNLAKQISDKLQYLDPVQFDGLAQISNGNNQMLVRSDADPNFIFCKTGGIPVTAGTTVGLGGYKYNVGSAYWIGASQASLVWNQDNREVFAFDYLHTPWLNAGQLSLKYYKDGTTDKFYLIPQQSGIFLVDVQPKSFFESLGFKISDIVVDLATASGVQFVPSDAELLRVTTSAYSGIQNLFPTGARKIDDATVPNAPNGFIDASNTVMLLANDRNLDDTGHFLIEISFGNSSGKYLFDSGSLHHIFGIVSKQYISDGFVTGFSDSAVPYVHNGTNFLIQNMKIRILDPATKEPIKTLGKNSTLYLEIFKNTMLQKAK